MENILASFTVGLLATTSPCVLPLYPGFLAYLSGGGNAVENQRGRYFLGVFVLAGVLSMMLLIGLIIALLSVSIGSFLAIIVPLADLILLGLGVLLFMNINPFKRLPQIQVPYLSNPYINAYLYGLLYGPIALPCSGPFVVSIFALSLTVGELASKLVVFFWFGLGFGLPLLALSFLSGMAQRRLTRFFARRARLVNLIGGVLLVGVALYDLASNWSLILFSLGI